MSRKSYNASERRGILVIAFISLALIGAGLGVTLCERRGQEVNSYPELREYPALVDSVSIIKKDRKSSKKKKNSNSIKKKSNKNFKPRSPLDEPVS